MVNTMVTPSTAVALLALAAGNGAAAMAVSSTSPSSSPRPTGTSYPSGFEIKKSWGHLSPFDDAHQFGVEKGFPVECELSQVHVLHRHAQRYPTSWPTDGGGLDDFAYKVGNYSKKNPDKKIATGPLSFINEWEYLMGKDLLLPSGAATEATAGALFWSEYGRLLYRAGAGDAIYDPSMNTFSNGTQRPKPIFRTTSYPRILESARWWLRANSSYASYDLVVIPEEDNFNNTLSSTSTCTNGSSSGDNSVEQFIPSFTQNALHRFQGYFPSDFNLTTSDVYAMLTMCPYEYATLGRSSFCAIFTEQEWRDFEYSLDMSFYGNFGFGAPSGRAQGIGYVQELAARLQSRLIYSSNSSINYTYDDNTKEFPLHQPLYMDMSHDNVIISTLTALGADFFKYGPQGMPGSVPHAVPRNFILSQVVPFGARLFSEIWTCPKDAKFDHLQEMKYKNPDLSSESHTTDYIRFVLNNAPMSTKGMKGCEGSVNGFCPLKSFLDSVPGLVDEAMYQEACFGNYNITSQVGNGQPIDP